MSSIYKRKLLAVLSIIFICHLVSGQNFDSKYRIISLAKFSDKLGHANKVSTKRYVVLPLNVRRPLKVLEKARSEDSIFSASMEVIFDNQLKSFDKIERSQGSPELISIAKACYYIQKENYTAAKDILETNDFEMYKFYKYLFLADCTYDSEKRDAISKSIEIYQLAYDNTTKSILKDLVKHRVNFIRYNEK